jgi:hypothetical protein
MSFTHQLTVDIASMMPTWPPDIEHTYEIHFDGYRLVVSRDTYTEYHAAFDGPRVVPEERHVYPDGLYEYIARVHPQIIAYGPHGDVRDRAGHPFIQVIANEDEEPEAPYIDLAHIPVGRANAVGKNTQFINQNFMGLNNQPKNKKDYVYLTSELGANGKAHRAWHRAAIEMLKTNAQHPVTGEPMRINDFRRVVDS